MSHAHFPSGPWLGFFTYHGKDCRFMMELVLEFKEGKMTGEGTDCVGAFVISGNYSPELGECSWVKQYVGMHSVDYKGFREGKGIWGTWTLPPVNGGFKIWPLGGSESLRETRAVAEVEAPATISELALPRSAALVTK